MGNGSIMEALTPEKAYEIYALLQKFNPDMDISSANSVSRIFISRLSKEQVVEILRTANVAHRDLIESLASIKELAKTAYGTSDRNDTAERLRSTLSVHADNKEKALKMALITYPSDAFTPEQWKAIFHGFSLTQLYNFLTDKNLNELQLLVISKLAINAVRSEIKNFNPEQTEMFVKNKEKLAGSKNVHVQAFLSLINKETFNLKDRKERVKMTESQILSLSKEEILSSFNKKDAEFLNFSQIRAMAARIGVTAAEPIVHEFVKAKGKELSSKQAKLLYDKFPGRIRANLPKIIKPENADRIMADLSASQGRYVAGDLEQNEKAKHASSDANGEASVTPEEQKISKNAQRRAVRKENRAAEAELEDREKVPAGT